MKLFILLTLMSVFVWFSFPPVRRRAKQRSPVRHDPTRFDAQ
ncbi:MAG: hypothetical protein ACRECV_06310 [Xanthobacteraceae bacterium]